MIKKYKIHSAVGNYSFIEAESSDVNDLIEMHNLYSDMPLSMNNGSYITMDSFTGEKILFNKESHTYLSLDREQLVGGSTFAADYKKSFPRDHIAKAIAKKHDCKISEVTAQWDMAGTVACDFGTAMHAAIEYHFIHRENPFYKLPKHKFIKQIIETLPAAITENKVIPEALVSNVRRKMCGQIDLLEITGKKKCKLLDWKNSGDIKSSLYPYEIQINYYAKILEFAGWEVEAMEIWNHDGVQWDQYIAPKLDLNNLTIKK